MPNPGFKPDEPGYYTLRYDGTTVLNNLMGTVIRGHNSEEQETAELNKANMRAFIRAYLPSEPDSIEKMKDLLKVLPGLKLNLNAEQMEARRRLSEKARDAIADAAVRMWSVNKAFDKQGMNRTFRTLLSRDDSEEGMKANAKVNNIMVNGTPKERGEELTKHVNAAMDLLMKVVSGKMTDEELVDNFEKLHIVSNLATNAQMLREMTTSNDPARRIEVTPDIREKLRYLEFRSTNIAFAMERIRMIASANYPNLNMDYLLTADDRTYRFLTEYLGSDMWEGEKEKLGRSITENDIQVGTESARGMLSSVRKANLMEQIEHDFPEEKNIANLQFVGIKGDIVKTEFTLKNNNHDVENNLFNGHVLVTTPSGDSTCYYINANGSLRKAKADDMMNDAATELSDVLKEMRLANKGLFIGSKEFSNTLSGLEKVAKEIKKLGNPPDPDVLRQMTSRLSQAVLTGEKYLENHQPDKDHEDYNRSRPYALLSERQRIRSEAIEYAISFCKKHISLIELQQNAKEAEMRAVKDFYRGDAKDYDKVDLNDANFRVMEEYSEGFVHVNDKQEISSNVLSPSNVGNSADELRASVMERLDKMISDSRSNQLIYDGDLSAVRNVMSDMVVLELVKKGRTKDENDNIIAGEIEQALAESPGKLVTSFRNHPAMKKMTDDMSLDKLRHFVVTGGAKTMADYFMKVRQQDNPGNVKNEPNKEMEKVPGMGKNV